MSSKRKIRRERCEGKQKYKSEKFAIVQAAKARALTGDYIRCYRCPFCRHWHIGHAPKTFAE